jgi:putative ABC transport system permease protein
METLIQDARYALRSLRRTPAFSLAALVTLALGIGATTAIFTVINATLLRPLPFPHPEQLVHVMRHYPTGTERAQTGLRYLFFRDHLSSVSALAAWRGASGVNLALGDRAAYVEAVSVSKEFFEVFGVQPMLGRPFSPEEDRDGGPDAVILSHGLWLSELGGDPGIVGRSVSLGGRSYTVVGVMPQTFVFSPAPDLLVPLRPGVTGPGGGYNYTVAGRLKPGVSIEQGSAETSAIWQSLKADFSRQIFRSELPSVMASVQEVRSRGVRPTLLVILAAVGLLLLIACGNVANLLLVRASRRSREIAMRAALGAGRRRLVRQLLTESVLLSLGGAAAGVMLAHWTIPALLALSPRDLPVAVDVRIDATVLLVTIGLAVLTGVLFGLVPALSLSRHDLIEAFRDDGTRATAGRRSGWTRQALVAGEVALCMVLLVSAALLVQTFVKMRSIDPGFDPRGVLAAQMSLQGDRYRDPAAFRRLFGEGLERLRRIPGVSSAAVVNGVPIEQGLNLNVDVLDGPEEVKRALTDWRYASIDYFRTMGIDIVAGRGFEERDREGAPPIAVVNEEFARRFFKGTPALGHHVRVFDSDGPIEIVGIAENVREQGLVGNLPAMMFVPVAQANPSGVSAAHTYFPMSWVVRTSDAGGSTIARIREAIHEVDPQQPFSSFRTMEDVKLEQLTSERFQTALFAAFAAIGLMLAAAGIYGLVAYAVSQRTRELGIRLALGATPQGILVSVVSSAALLALCGVVAGAAAALAFTRTLRTALWGVSTGDPLTFVGVAAILLLVAVVSSLVPAFRAVRLDPVSALKD